LTQPIVEAGKSKISGKNCCYIFETKGYLLEGRSVKAFN
jgi:hypothetical protein